MGHLPIPKIMSIKNFGTKIKMTIWLMRTKLLCRQAWLIRFPFDLWGKRYIDLDRNLTTGIGCRLETFSTDGKQTMHFVRNVQLNDCVHICAMQDVPMGDNVLMAGHIYISDNSHGSYKGTAQDTTPNISQIERLYHIAAVRIGDAYGLGKRSRYSVPCVAIGRGSVIGANSIVNRDIPFNTIAAGQPVRAVKRYDPESKSWEKYDHRQHRYL